MGEIGVGVVGFGLGARVFHCPFVSAVPGMRLRAIVNRSGDAAGRAYPQATIVRTSDELFASPEIDLVVVTTPNDTHVELARRALKAGKHVVIDKPMAPRADEARELIELAQEVGRVVVPFHNRRFDGDFLTLQALLHARTLGRVVTIESHFDRFRPIPRENTWKEADHAANGLLMDLGPHLVDQALALFGMPETITASVRRDRSGTEIEDAFDILLGYGKMLYWCRTSMLAAEASPRFLVHGTAGSFRKWGIDPQEAALVAGATPPTLGEPGLWLREPESEWGTLALAPDPNIPGVLTRSTVPTLPGDYRLFYAGVRDTILDGAPPPVPAEAGYEVARLLELARQSSQEKRTLAVRPTSTEPSPGAELH